MLCYRQIKRWNGGDEHHFAQITRHDGCQYERLNKAYARRSKQPASPWRKEEHAGEGVIGASQARRMRGSKIARRVSAIIKAQQISDAALDEFRGRLAPEKGSYRSECIGQIKPRGHHQHSICPAEGFGVMAMTSSAARDRKSFFFCRQEWAMLAVGSASCFRVRGALVGRRIGVTQPGVSLMG